MLFKDCHGPFLCAKNTRQKQLSEFWIIYPKNKRNNTHEDDYCEASFLEKLQIRGIRKTDNKEFYPRTNNSSFILAITSNVHTKKTFK